VGPGGDRRATILQKYYRKLSGTILADTDLEINTTLCRADSCGQMNAELANSCERSKQ